MRCLASIIWLCLALALFVGCAHYEQAPMPRQTEAADSEARLKALVGVWKCSQMTNHLLGWEGVGECVLRVRAIDPGGVTDGKGGLREIDAELLVRGADGKLVSAPDSQPAFLKQDTLYFGPIGSCYSFVWKLNGTRLHLALPADGKRFHGTFELVSRAPGKGSWPKWSPPE